MEKKDSFAFLIQSVDKTGKARAGFLKTPHGLVKTPVLIPASPPAPTPTFSNKLVGFS